MENVLAVFIFLLFLFSPIILIATMYFLIRHFDEMMPKGYKAACPSCKKEGNLAIASSGIYTLAMFYCPHCGYKGNQVSP